MTQVNDSHFSIRYVLIIRKSGLDGSHPHANDTLQLVHSRGYDLGTRRHIGLEPILISLQKLKESQLQSIWDRSPSIPGSVWKSSKIVVGMCSNSI